MIAAYSRLSSWKSNYSRVGHGPTVQFPTLRCSLSLSLPHIIISWLLLPRPTTDESRVSRARIEVTFTIKITREFATRGLAPKRYIGTFYFGFKSQTWHLSKMKRNKIMITCLSTIQAHDPRTQSHSLRTIVAIVQRCNRWACRHQLPIAKLHRLPSTAITKVTLISDEKARRSDKRIVR